jgi:ankyrin repeat protein
METATAASAAQAEDKSELLAASTKGSLVKVVALLRANADSNTRDDQGRTPLVLACCKHHTDIVAALVDAGAVPDTDAVTVLLASKDDHADLDSCLDLLLFNVDREHGEVMCSMALAFFAENNFSLVTLLPLLKHGANVNQVLILLILHDPDAMGTVAHLIDNCDADPNLADSDAHTPLYYAICEVKNAALAALLLQKKATAHAALLPDCLVLDDDALLRQMVLSLWLKGCWACGAYFVFLCAAT